MNYLKISVGVVLALSLSRFLPHPPNFTSLLALSFYVPIIFGKKFIPAIILSFAITDYIIGYHSLTHWTWGSVVIIGLISQYFKNSIYKRVGGALSGALIFFIITNFGFWISSGFYSYDLYGLFECYVAAIPFYKGTLLGTIFYTPIFIGFYYYLQNKVLILKAKHLIY